jgi:hypothetical protein
LRWLTGSGSLAVAVAVAAAWRWRAKLPPAVAAARQSDGGDGSTTAWRRWRQRRWQLGGGMTAASAWRRRRGGGSLVAVAVVEAGLGRRLGMVVVAMAAAWQQLGSGQMQKKNKKIWSFNSYKTISIGKLLWDMRNRSKICANGHFFQKAELVSWKKQ